MIKLIKKGGLLVVSFILSIFGAVGAVDLTDNANAESISKKSNKTIITPSANGKNNLQDADSSNTESQKNIGDNYYQFSTFFQYLFAGDEEGMTVAGEYLYSLRKNGDTGYITRVNMQNKNFVDMDMDDRNLGHGNDMSLVHINGEPHLMVATASSATNYKIIDFAVKDTKLTKKFEFFPVYDSDHSSELQASGIHVRDNGSSVTFFLKYGAGIFSADIPTSSLYSDSTIYAKKFGNSINPADSYPAQNVAEYAWLKNPSNYDYQGFTLYKSLFYVVVSGKSDNDNYKKYSTVLVFNMDGSINTSNSFRASNEKYKLLEFEAVAISDDGHIYMNSNVDTTSENSQLDAIFTYPVIL